MLDFKTKCTKFDFRWGSAADPVNRFLIFHLPFVIALWYFQIFPNFFLLCLFSLTFPDSLKFTDFSCLLLTVMNHECQTVSYAPVSRLAMRSSLERFGLAIKR